MKAANKTGKKEITVTEKQSMWGFFTLFFPSITIFLVLLLYPGEVKSTIIGLMLFFYQAVLLKKFVEQHYQGY